MLGPRSPPVDLRKPGLPGAVADRPEASCLAPRRP